MALIVSAASGNFNAGATWVGGVVPAVGDQAQAASGHTITITESVSCDEIRSAITGKFVINNGVTLTANVIGNGFGSNVSTLEFNSPSPAIAYIVGTISSSTTGNASAYAVSNLNNGTLHITSAGGISGSNQTSLSLGNVHIAVRNAASGIIHISGNCTGGMSGTGGIGNHSAVINSGAGAIYITGNCTAGTSAGGAYGAFNSSTGTLSVTGTLQASAFYPAVGGSNAQQTTILSGPFLTEITRGVAPVYCAAWRWNALPSNSTYMEVMTNNLLAKRSLYTADNITGMPAASNVKSGITYGPSSELTGTFEQTVTPSTADIATAVWGAATRSITGGTVDTLTNAPASVTPSDIWSHASRTITGGTVTTLTNAPSVPSAASIRAEIDSNSTQLAAIKAKTDALPASPAATGDIPSANITAIKAKTDLLVTDRLAQCSTVATTGAQLAAALS